MKLTNYLMGTTDNKYYNSFIICVGAVALFLGLKYIFPMYDWSQTETAVLTALSAWIINSIRMNTK